MKYLAILIVVLTSGCATILTGTKQTVLVESEPAGATVKVNGLEKGVTPLPLKLKKGNDAPIITLELDGYEDESFQPETSFNPVAILNLFSIINWAVDAATGAVFKYDEKLYHVTLDKE